MADYVERKRTTFGRYDSSKSGRRFKTIYPFAGEHIPSKNRSRFTPLYKEFPSVKLGGRFKVLREIGRALASRDMTKNIDKLLPSLGLIIGMVLFSGNITGDAILNSSQTDANLAGTFAIIIGLVGLLVLRRR